MRNETLEQALKNELGFINDSVRSADFDLGFQTGGLIGAKWQAERMAKEKNSVTFNVEWKADPMYPEQEVLDILSAFADKYAGKFVPTAEIRNFLNNCNNDK